jgi:hypothetical protein
VFKGYVSRDRRKAYVVEADRAADQLLSRAAASRELPQHAMFSCLTSLSCSWPVSYGVLCSIDSTVLAKQNIPVAGSRWN